MDTIDINGHRCTRIGDTDPTDRCLLFNCEDCGATLPYFGFQTGAQGCPGRPESLNYLRVCVPDTCPGHLDTDSAEYRAWKEITSIPTSSVPRLTCQADTLGSRAADQYRHHARRIGLPMDDWHEEEGFGGAGGGIVATFRHRGRPYQVSVTTTGGILTASTD